MILKGNCCHQTLQMDSEVFEYIRTHTGMPLLLSRKEKKEAVQVLTAKYCILLPLELTELSDPTEVS